MTQATAACFLLIDSITFASLFPISWTSSQGDRILFRGGGRRGLLAPREERSDERGVWCKNNQEPRQRRCFSRGFAASAALNKFRILSPRSSLRSSQGASNPRRLPPRKRMRSPWTELFAQWRNCALSVKKNYTNRVWHRRGV
jgi:hypothetical protein